MDYKEQLKDKRWIELSAKVKDFYDHRCCGCGNNNDLHVHHKRYFKGRKAWEYDIGELVCLCSGCHETFHKNFDELQEIITNYRLYYSYEFSQILKVIELMCSLDTNDYSKVINYIKTLDKNTF